MPGTVEQELSHLGRVLTQIDRNLNKLVRILCDHPELVGNQCPLCGARVAELEAAVEEAEEPGVIRQLHPVPNSPEEGSNDD